MSVTCYLIVLLHGGAAARSERAGKRPHDAARQCSWLTILTNDSISVPSFDKGQA